MGLDEPNELEGRVKRGVEVLRESSDAGGAGLSEELIRRTIEKARAAARDEGTVSLRRSWQMKMVRRFSVAAGIGMLLSGASLWLVWGGTRVAFADVVEKVKETQAVRCHVEMEIPGQKPVSEEMLMVDPGWAVTEPEMGSGSKMIINHQQHKMLMLMGGPGSGRTGSKMAISYDMAKLPASKQTPSLLEEFKDVEGKDSKPLGEKEIDGVKVRGFDIVKPHQEMEVWADVKTERPVLVTMKMSVPMFQAGALRYTFSDFDWKPEYDPGELSFAIPPGYVEQKIQADMSEPTEADVVAMLKLESEMNDGLFPSGLGMKELMPILAKLKPLVHKMTDKEKTAVMTELMGKIMPISRGWGYMMRPAKGSGWMYAGENVAAGEKGRIILWYKTAAGGLRAFDADFAVHDVKEAELPANGQAVKLEMFPTGGVPQ
jgi:hypothetical protein